MIGTEYTFIVGFLYIFFTSSATECWEIIAQSLIDTHSYHFFNGAFGEKWFNYTKKLCPYAIGYRFEVERELRTSELDLSTNEGIICITQNETSNGTQVSNDRIKKIRKLYPNHLIAVDATSSMAGISLDFQSADVWYASVQKCFGLPAGMAIMVCSPKAIDIAREKGENEHYNSLNFIIKNTELFQTPYTPNVLNIYLLKRTLENSKTISEIDRKIRKVKAKHIALINRIKGLSLFVHNSQVLSDTVLTIKASEDVISQLHEKAEKAGIILGRGYGSNKMTTFRIANFPAIETKEIKVLHEFLKRLFEVD
ncbi:MAG: aminotransferase class V-fold PLP-dependent enzyme [Bacteroidota bacterium]